MDVTDAEGVTPEAEGDTVWCQMGVGWTAMTESPSAQSKERKFINEKSKRKNITSYAPSIAFEALLMFLNPAIRKVYDIYTKRKTGTAAVVPMVTGNFNGQGDEAIGWFDPANGKWSDTKPTAQPSGQADTPAPESENE